MNYEQMKEYAGNAGQAISLNRSLYPSVADIEARLPSNISDSDRKLLLKLILENLDTFYSINY